MLAASLRHPALTAQIVPAPHTLVFDRSIIEMIASGYIGELIGADKVAAAVSPVEARVTASSPPNSGGAPRARTRAPLVGVYGSGPVSHRHSHHVVTRCHPIASYIAGIPQTIAADQPDREQT